MYPADPIVRTIRGRYGMWHGEELLREPFDGPTREWFRICTTPSRRLSLWFTRVMAEARWG